MHRIVRPPRTDPAACPAPVQQQCGFPGDPPGPGGDGAVSAQPAVADVLAAPQQRQRPPRGGASRGSGIGVSSRSGPRLTRSRRSCGIAAAVTAARTHAVAITAPSTRRAPRRRWRRRSAGSRGDLGAARYAAALRSRSAESSLQRSNVSSSSATAARACTSGSRDARELRQELAPALPDRLTQVGRRDRRRTGTAQTTRTPVLGTAAACRARGASAPSERGSRPGDVS